MSIYEIGINNLTTNEIDEDFVKKVAQNVLIGENRKEGILSIVFLGAGRMRKLNKKYRKKNRVTDVLSFENLNPNIPNSPNQPNLSNLPKNQLGEVVICLSEVKKNAKRCNSDPVRGCGAENERKKLQSSNEVGYNKELARVLIHGILHLVGYDHEKSEDDAEKMEKRQEEYLLRVISNFK